MNNGELDVVRQGTALRRELIGYHFEDMLQFGVRLRGGSAEGMTAIDRRNIGHVAPIIIPATDNLVIKKSLHPKLT